MKLIAILFIALLTACSSEQKEPEQLLEKVAQLERKIDQLNADLIKKDSLQDLTASTKAPTKDSVPKEKKSNLHPQPQREKTLPIELPKTLEQVVVNTEKEKTFYYKTGKKSVVISPWIDGKRTTTLFDPWEKETYQIEETRSSYSIIAEVMAFHDNGAVDKIKVDTHPDASMYWYETTYTFGINNQPEWMYSTQYPQTHLEMPGDNAYYWNKKTGAWVKQGLAIETIVPPER